MPLSNIFMRDRMDSITFVRSSQWRGLGQVRRGRRPRRPHPPHPALTIPTPSPTHCAILASPPKLRGSTTNRVSAPEDCLPSLFPTSLGTGAVPRIVTRTAVVVWEPGNVEWGLGMGKVEWNGATVRGWHWGALMHH